MEATNPPHKRKFASSDHASASAKRARTSGPEGSTAGSGGGGAKMTFAQRMMAKMGYVEGQGLGKTGEGMLSPVEVKLRPQGAGVGAVKEQTKQYKEEKRRKAKLNGEEVESSEDDEGLGRRRRRGGVQSATGSGSGASTPRQQDVARKPKVKYRTVADVQAAAPGLQVPVKMLGSIVDATGSRTKLLTSTSGLMTGGLGAEVLSAEEKLARRERLELEAFIDAWHGIQEQKVRVEEEQGQRQMEFEQDEDDVNKLRAIIAKVEDLKIAPRASRNYEAVDDQAEGAMSQWGDLIQRLETLQLDHRHDIEKYGLVEAAVGTLAPLLKERLADWEPLERPDKLTADLERIRVIVGLEPTSDIMKQSQAESVDAEYGRLLRRRNKASTPYETLMYTVWLPKVRTAVTNWDILDNAPMVAVAQAWRELLPPFVYTHFIDKLIVPRLVAALQIWDPRKRTHHHRHHTSGAVALRYAEPHTWLFPWLPQLPPYQLSLSDPLSLLTEIKRRLRSVLTTWDLTSGILPGLIHFKTILGTQDYDQLLIHHVLPRLATHLSRNLTIDPADQDLSPLESTLTWHSPGTLLDTNPIARLLTAEFFPKWHAVLHSWLIAPEASFAEIAAWFAWWKEQFPEPLASHQEILEQWHKASTMINRALDLLDKDEDLTTSLRGPELGPAKPASKSSATSTPKTATKPTASASAALRAAQQLHDEADFKSYLLTSWTASQDLLMLPVRDRAHPTTGETLYRVRSVEGGADIGASGAGRGGASGAGVLVVVRGDIVWAAERDEQGREKWVPVPLEGEGGLVERARARA